MGAPSTKLQLCVLCPPLLPVVSMWLVRKVERDDEHLFLFRGIWSMSLAVSSKVAGPESRTLSLFLHLIWSRIPRDGSASPGRDASPILVSSRLDCLSQMGISSIYVLHLICFKWLHLIFVSIVRPLAERIFNSLGTICSFSWAPHRKENLDHGGAGKQASDRKRLKTGSWSLYEMVDSR